MLGKTFSHYRVLDLLGAGGMGEVYRAEDTVLGREVALKVLLEAFTQDRERLARFEREAKVLATLDHPNIASIYAFEQDQDVHFLVMQLAAGETLAERIDRGPIPLEEAFPIASQIAQGLEAAHEKGVIHRDLKPGNIKIDSEGEVRILDFGLAKAMTAAREGASLSPTPLSESPTLTAEMTSPGVLLGTAAYMSPEQARGKPVDRRADIWAFGCVLYEMLTGKQAFAGETITDHLAKIIEREPDWEALPKETPTSVRTLLRRCLAKDPKSRLHDIGDARIEIEEVPEQAVLETVLQTPTALWKRIAPWVLALVAASIALWSLLKPGDGPAPPSTSRFPLATQQLAVGPHPVSPIIALSRDGSLLAYVSGEEDTGKIILRRLDSFEEKAVVDKEGAQAPFFSPDGLWIGFAADGQLKKVRIEGGKVTTLCDVEVMHGATWGADDTIIFSGADGLSRISAAGGTPVAVTEEDVDLQGEIGHHSPELLPGGDAVTFVATGGSGTPLEIALFDLVTGERKTLVEGGGNARILPSGHLVYASQGKLFAAKFDLENHKVTGDPVVVVPDLMMGFPREPSLGHFTVSDTGTLAYLSGPSVAGGSRWVWVDRAGSLLRKGDIQKMLLGPKISPDGTRIAVSTEKWDQSGTHVWIDDLTRGTFSRLTFEQVGYWPLWSPDGRRIAFSTWDEDETLNIFWISADGSGAAERLTRGDLWRQSASWTQDGNSLIFHRSLHPETGWDVLEIEIGSGSEAKPLLNSRFDERQPDLSPDNQWLAYVSNETGRNEVYVRRYPGLSDKWQISNQGGAEPVWSHEGNELFYRVGQKIMVVEVAGKTLNPSRPREMFEGNYTGEEQYGRSFDVAPDDQGFIFIEQSSAQEADFELRIALDWMTEVEGLVSPGQN